MLATIEIDLGPLANEWEVVAVRQPRDGEFYWHCDEAVRAREDFKRTPMIIVRRKWVWPSWLKARWYAEDKDGSQWGYMQNPELLRDRWEADGVAMARFDEWFEIPKIGGDWKLSLRENPNWRPSNGQKDT